jgi:hypothetical protein
MTGQQWETLLAWQLAGEGRDVRIDLRYEIRWGYPCRYEPVMKITVTDNGKGTVWVDVSPEDIDRINDKLLDQATAEAKAAISNGMALLSKLSATGGGAA